MHPRALTSYADHVMTLCGTGHIIVLAIAVSETSTMEIVECAGAKTKAFDTRLNIPLQPCNVRSTPVGVSRFGTPGAGGFRIGTRTAISGHSRGHDPAGAGNEVPSGRDSRRTTEFEEAAKPWSVPS